MPEEFVKQLQEGRDQLAQGQVSESRDTFLKVIRRSSEIGDRLSLADAFCGLAEAQSDLENFPAAEHIYSNAAVLYRELGDSLRLAKVLHQQTALLRRLGKITEADATEQEARSLDQGHLQPGSQKSAGNSSA